MDCNEDDKDDGVHEVFDDTNLGMVVVFLFLLQLLGYTMNKQYCTC